MRNVLIVLFLLVSTSIWAWDITPFAESYVLNDGKWYFADNHRHSSKEVINIDSLTFETVYSDTPWFTIGEYYYAKDKNYVYYKGERIEGAEPHSFKVIYPHFPYSKDDKNVYFETKKVENADLATFELIVFRSLHMQTPYAKDKNYIFSNGVIMSYDLSTFIILDGGFYNDNPLRNYNTPDFFYTADKSGIYYNDKLLKDTSLRNFRFIKWAGEITHTISNDKVYFQDSEIKGACAEFFKILDKLSGHGYTIARDINNIYINGQIFTEVDTETFKIINRNEIRGLGGVRSIGDVIIKDKNGTYRIEQNQDGTFAIIPIGTE